MVEILLIRVMEVVLLPNIGYAVITSAMFAFGLAGVYVTVWPLSDEADVPKRLAVIGLLLAVSVLLIRPALNGTIQVYSVTSVLLLRYAIAGILVYLILLIPFFLSGLLFAYIFSAFPGNIRTLYFWDLAGAAVGCVIFLPFLRNIGPGGLMFVAGAAALFAAALFTGKKRLINIAAAVAVGLILVPFLKDSYFEFEQHENKRGVRQAHRGGIIEFTEWDPISKIEVIPTSYVWKHIAYDGGNQSSHIYKFDGKYDRLRESLLKGDVSYKEHFWHRGVIASHYLKRDTDAEVLIFGSAAGQETKGALLFHPERVDGIELVKTVVDLGKYEYADFNGNIFNDPRVNNRVGEGRSYLRSTDKKYDIIQIFSNHNTSHVSAGIGASKPIYLQTVEAYTEYFSHLTIDGILQVNHHYYPRVITTAAEAWNSLGRMNFSAHVVVFERPGVDDTLPTMLMKMTPWTASEIRELKLFFSKSNISYEKIKPEIEAELVINPLEGKNSFLSEEFFQGKLPAEFQKELAYNAQPATDNMPYLQNIQKGFDKVQLDTDKFLNINLVNSINGRLSLPLGEYTIPAGIAVVGLLFSIILVFIPLKFSTAGKVQWPDKSFSLIYFAFLGSGFIIIELVLIQIFMKLVGFPLYTYTVVIFTMLLAAGLGSLTAHRLDISPENKWYIPFIGIAVTGLILLFTHSQLFGLFLQAPAAGRIIAAFIMIFPMAFFMGMPFPLGILHLKNQPRGAVAWAWGINGVFTVLGGVLAGTLSIFIGFRLTFLIALGIYMIAYFTFFRLTVNTTSSVMTAQK
jgi:spermidine synthase